MAPEGSDPAQLREMGCDYGQGYYYSRPVTSAEIRAQFAEAWSIDRIHNGSGTA